MGRGVMRNGVGSVQSVLVLGGSSDIASATVLQLARNGSRRVLLAGRASDRLNAAADRVRTLAAEVECLPFDATDTGSHPSFVEGAFSGGDIDLVLMAVGVLGDQERCTIEAEDAVRVANTNYTGPVSVLTLVARYLTEQGHGDIVVLSSVAGERARASNFVYGSSKAGLDAFSQGLGDRLHGSGVRVMVVRPGFVRTKMTTGLPVPPLSTTPEAVAAAIVDGLRRRAEVVWVPASLRWVMSGVRHLPRPAFRRLPF